MYEEADAPPALMDADELRRRLECLPPAFDKNSLKPMKMLSRTGRRTAKRKPSPAEQMSRTAPMLMKTQAGSLTGTLSTERAALALTARHVLSKPHKIRRKVSPQKAIIKVQEAAVVPFVEAQLVPKNVSFLDSLDLTPQQMAAFIDDAGSFFYLTRRQKTSSAYDLKVCAWAQVDESDYFTVSCSGVTQFEKSDSEFTSLNVWEKEFKDYHAMAKINFFAQYRSWKTFQVWKKVVKRGKIKAAAKAIKDQLFLFKPALRDSLLNVQGLCQDTLQLGLLSADSAITYELQDFVKEQEQRQAEMAEGLVRFSADVQQVARTACDDVVDAFLKAANIVADHRMTFMERAALRSECRKLTRFLRLVDCHVVAALRELALEAAANALRLVNPPPSKLPKHVVYRDDPDTVQKVDALAFLEEDEEASATPLFRVEVSFVEGELQLLPSKQDMQLCFNDVLQACLRVVGIPDRIFAHPDLALYVMTDGDEAHGEQKEEVTVQDLVSREPAFISCSQDIADALANTFDQTSRYCEVFQPYAGKGSVSAENDAFLKTMSTHFGDPVDLAEYSGAIDKFRDQRDDFRGIPRSADVAILRVDSLALKTALLPSPTRCVDALQALLPELMDRGFKRLLKDIATQLPIVIGSPQDVAEFVQKVKTVKEAQGSVEGYTARQEHLKLMAKLMDKEKWPVPESQKANLTMCEENMGSLDTGAQIAEAREEEDSKKFAEEIEREVPALKKKVGLVREKLDDPILASVHEKPSTVLSFLDAQSDSLDDLRARSETLSEYQVALGLDVDEYDTLDEVQLDLTLKLKLWRGVKEWSQLTAGWVVTPLLDMDASELEKQVNMYSKTAFQAMKGMPGNPVVPRLKDSVDTFTPLLPCVVNLRNTNLQERHWADIHELLGFEVKGDVNFTLGDILNRGVTEHADALTVLATNATQESVLEEMMAKVAAAWETTELIVTPYKDVKDLYILGDTTDVIAALDESLVTVNTVLGSRYVGGIRDFVEGWRKNLILFQDTLDEWLACQRAWMYLETIFASADIIRQLPAAAKKFQGVDKSWKALMKATADDPAALKSCTVAGRKELFLQHNAVLDKIQKSLDEYIETKCSAFPRFYFLSADELLEILSQSKNPQAVQPHMRKCFDNLVKLDFGDDPSSVDIHAMFSGEGERVALGKNLKARGNVEDWLSSVEARMKQSLHGCMKAGLLEYDTVERDEWVVGGTAGQVVATVVQMMWARGTEKAIREDGMQPWYQTNLDDLQGLIKKIRSDLTSLQRKCVVALVTTDVHARDIIEDLIAKGVSRVDDFNWMQQLRYYWENKDGGEDCWIKHSDAIINYGYEYMGCASRLVITPLTDRCWLTLTGSYGLKLGAAPSGPAGTGKTESSKDLAKAMAIQCVVFNCSDQIDYKMMGKLFRGLAQSGSWVCLDEFNRIDIEVLSVIAQQLLVIREGRLAGKTNINFMGVEIKLVDHHVIITMNPGYAGRTELPDNLQVCFRPVSMMVPNYALIAEIMLFAEGFGDAKTLSRKMCKLYILCSEQLSQQPHYDYGLRAVKSVLVMAGGLKRANPDISEDLVLIRALRDSNLPKFLADDIPLFFAIIKDLFPGVVVPDNDYGEFQVAMEEEITKAGLQNIPGFHKKVIQMFDIFNIRFGATLVGPTGAGKSTCYRILSRIMSSLHAQGSKNEQYQEVTFEILNPKCITMGELYGEVNMVTQEWRDGLASTIMRRAVNDESPVRKWTVFDGPIDALWIENMNTVLDDNMTLCLANGERIKLKEEMKMLFEVMDLAVASPATVSRIGVVFMTPSDLGWMPYVTSWTQTFPEQVPPIVTEKLIELYDACFQKGLTFQRKKCKEPVGCVDIQLATSSAMIFQSILFGPESKVKFEVYAEKPDLLLRLVEKLWFFSFVWSVGGSCQAKDHDQFDDFAKEMMETSGEDGSAIPLDVPGMGTAFDYFVDTTVEGGKFAPWTKLVGAFKFDKELAYTAIMVPTEDTTRFSYLMRTLITVDKPVFVTGMTGTGKTVMVQNLLRSLEPYPDEGGLAVIPTFMNFSAQTLSLITQQAIESKLEKKRKNLLGAPAGKKCIFFVDDINMPLTEEYGAQPPVELLRQFLDHKGFYDRDKLFFKDITDVMLFTGAAPPGGGRSVVTPRFTRHYNVLCVPPASENVMKVIFESIFAGFMKPFEKEVQRLVGGIVAATIEIYDSISAELLPTPAKFHYTFNLRDISKVFQGMLMISSVKCKDQETLAKLWLHESQRVFYDRLINFEDQGWFEKLACDLLSRHLGQMPQTPEQIFGEHSVLFCDFMKAGVDVESRRYELGGIDKITSLLGDALDEYNVSFPTRMNLVFFSDAVRHIARMSRILRQPRGNAMLVGVGGSGKQSTTRMAAFIGQMPCLSIEISRGYGLKDFREDIKVFMIKTGVEGENVAFLFTDTQVVEESMLEDVNSILNSGEIPNLFPQDELDKICSDMIPVCDELGVPASRDNCVATFIARVWDKLHICLCMSPVGDALRVRCRQFPSLVNCCTIDWYLGWPESALFAVANQFLASFKFGAGTDAKEEICRSAVAQICVKVHTSINETGEKFFNELRRKTYTTPKSYLDLIGMYSSKLGELQGNVDVKIEQMEVGCAKLAETNAVVDGLRGELEELGPVLVKKAADAEVMLKQVAIDQAEADVVKEKVSAEEKTLSVQSAEVKAVADDAQADLDVAMPALNNAVKALDSLTKADITEVKAFASPPPAVQLTMEGVCIMLQESPDWKTAKKVLGDSKFLENLKGYDKDNIPEPTIKKLQKYVNDEGMSVDTVGRVSSAAKGLCMWLHAMNTYHRVAKTVGPKRAMVAELNAKLDKANSELQEKRDNLKAVIEKVAQLQKTCAETVDEKEKLMQAQAQTAMRLQNAEKLTGGLSSEGVRWKENLFIYRDQRVDLIGDTLLSCAAISYYGPFTGTYRDVLFADWTELARSLDIPTSGAPTLLDTVGDPVQVREWQTQLLPTDEVSTNNAILVMQGQRWPLMIDPQAQANRWIRKMLEGDGLLTSTMTDINLLRVLENGIRNGKPLLIEDVHEAIEPALEPVLAKAIFTEGARRLIRLGDSNVDYDDLFKLFMTSKMPNPHYLPEVAIKTTIINFTVTMEGLEDQLLGDVVKAEMPDVERKNVQLLLQMSADKKKVAELEADILKRLSEAQGNILDDEDLINTLAESKKVSIMIGKRMEAAVVTKQEIDEARECYRTVATRGSIIYFVIADMAQIDPMYQYSLQYYQTLFATCLRDSEPCEVQDERLEIIIKYSTENCYANICRGLFEKDKTLYSALLVFNILRHADKIPVQEWALFVRGPGIVDRETQPENPHPDKIPEASWDLLCAAEFNLGDEETPSPFKTITKNIGKKWPEWVEWLEAPNPYEASLPAPFQDQTTRFSKLILVRALRDEQGLKAVNQFVRHEFGSALAEAQAGTMDEIYNDLDNSTPCIFILSKGSDPTGMLFKLAKQKEYSDRLQLVSLGQGQGPVAEALVEKGTKSGDWVLLQNCMLAKSWMHNLEVMCFNLGENKAKNHKDFRLFLTSSPAPYFPVAVLQNGVKMTNEPPKGIRANLLRSYQNLVKADEFDTCSKSYAFKRILSALCFFHGNILERRKFGPLGWNIRYAFDESDLETSINVMRRFLDEQETIPWDALRFITGHINYGGRVTDDWDRRCLLTILSIYFDEAIMVKENNEYKPHAFSKSGLYHPATVGPLEEHTQYFGSLPQVDEPEIFGMHENANITFNRAESSTLMSAILALQPRSASGGGGKSADEIVIDVIDDAEARIPSFLDEDDKGETTFVIQANGLLTSLDTVLQQEMVKFNRLLGTMTLSLYELRRAIGGQAIMSSDLDDMYVGLMNNALPPIWEKVSFATMKTLGSWMKDFLNRVEFMRKWLVQGLPVAFPLPVFFFPQGFMTGTLQTFARKYMVAIDTLAYKYDICGFEAPPEAPEDGVLCSGMMLEGARWDRELELVVPSDLGEMYTPLPIVHFIPCVDHVIPPTRYACPVYKTAERKGVLSTTGMSTNFVVAVELPTAVDPDTWVLAGVAALLNLTD